MNRHFNNRAVSQVIAALLLLAIAVAAAILLYVFAIGLLGSLGSGGGQQAKDEMIMESFNYPAGTTLTLTLRDVGSTSLAIGTADFYINGAYSGQATGCTGTLTPGQSCTGTVTYGGSSSLIAGASYPLKVVTPDGGVFSYTIVYGGSS
jgi:flagellin-like protein